ncbi:MAG TPA: hypothetical protein VJM50_15105 [Pyrinomonadaceae bacterium]|nr:hypothetical protein [Pyrinomonadaceae bacterium]
MRIGAVAVLFLSFVVAAAIIPTAVSSPGSSHALDEQLAKAEDASFLSLDVDTPLPFLRQDAAESFNALRDAVNKGAGFDFLARCGDMFRMSNAKALKLGVTFNSRHKLGEAFDYNQEDPRVLLVREYGSKGLKWRTYLRCEKQDGSLCTKRALYTDNAGFVSAYVFDFTAAAEQFGWERIHAHPGWTSEPTKKEFWHYQLRRTTDE